MRRCRRALSRKRKKRSSKSGSSVDAWWHKPVCRPKQGRLDLRLRSFFCQALSEGTPNEAVTKLVPSAEADSVCSTSDLPALPCRAFPCRHFVAEIGFVPPSVRGIEFRDSLEWPPCMP